MCRLCEIENEIRILSIDSAQLQRRSEHASACFKEAVTNNDRQEMEKRRIELHEILDMGLDKTAHHQNLTNEARAFVKEQLGKKR